MEAAANNHISILTMLLEAKADINQVNRIGRTALIEAACRGHPAIALRLCQARPNLDYRNMQHPLHLTALMEAASRGHDGVVFWLCEARADVNKPNKWGDTALIMAAHNNRFRSVQILVAQRANIDVRGDANLTALETAINQGHTRVAQFLSDPRLRDPIFLNELYTRFKAAQKEVLQDEVNYDASVASRRITTPPMPKNAFQWEEALEPIVQATENMSVSLKTLKLDDTQITVRRLPLTSIPAFGSTQWIATEPTRTSHNSRKDKLSHFQSVVSAKRDSAYPVLTLSDDCSWSYTGDTLSGDLGGTYELFHILTHPAVAAATVPNSIYATNPVNMFFYLVRLKTGGGADPATGASVPEQVVGFVLGRQIVLGRLVMEMGDHAAPWWLLNHDKEPSK